MHIQLQSVVNEFRDASERLQRLVLDASGELWSQRLQADRWSVAECVAHLILTGKAYIPLLERAIDEGRERGRGARRRYRRDPMGWLLWRTMGPPVRFRVRTSAPFIPTATAPATELVGEFERLQAAQIACVEAADGLRLERLWIQSPFNPRGKYNLYAALSILPRHQHRHLWQAEEVLRSHSGRIAGN